MNKVNYKNYSIIFILATLISACEKNETSNNNIISSTNDFSTDSVQKLESSVDLQLVTDKEFVMKVSEANKAEIELAQLALTKSSNSEIKSFAKQMVKDHTEALNDLKKIVVNKKITIADTLDAEHKSLKKKLKSMSGANFDNAYAQSQVEAHEKAVQLFKMETKQGKDKEIVEYANKYLPHIEMHLEMAKKIQAAAAKDTKSNQGM